MTDVRRDSDHLTETELVYRYGICFRCGSPRESARHYDAAGNLTSLALVCSNPACASYHPSLDDKETT